jgi:phosphoribosylaminoimidazolecarboxamide formyltransferase/IMP cyclohydrolase
VAVVVDNDDYGSVLEELSRHDGCLSRETRFMLAVKAFSHVAHYDAAIADYLTGILR